MYLRVWDLGKGWTQEQDRESEMVSFLECVFQRIFLEDLHCNNATSKSHKKVVLVSFEYFVYEDGYCSGRKGPPASPLLHPNMLP